MLKAILIDTDFIKDCEWHLRSSFFPGEDGNGFQTRMALCSWLVAGGGAAAQQKDCAKNRENRIRPRRAQTPISIATTTATATATAKFEIAPGGAEGPHADVTCNGSAACKVLSLNVRSHGIRTPSLMGTSKMSHQL